MQKFFIDSSHISNGHIIIDGEIGVHVIKSLRMKIGEAICFCDFQSTVYECVISDIDVKNVCLTADIVNEYIGDTEPTVKVVLYMSLPKSDKMDLIVQKCTELGVDTIYPVISDNCVVKLKDDKSINNKIVRWNKIALEAATQSGRCKIPCVENPVSFADAIADDGYDLRIIPYEKENALKLKDCLQSNDFGERQDKSNLSIACFIGPEGGYTEKEIIKANSCGVVPVTLGKRILRAETAAIATVAEILYEFD